MQVSMEKHGMMGSSSMNSENSFMRRGISLLLMTYGTSQSGNILDVLCLIIIIMDTKSSQLPAF
uniref:Uncharacterized protein n=1 Tax=Arundo donax TaxID=35708 RepID=A0A0A8XU49_ARUDO